MISLLRESALTLHALLVLLCFEEVTIVHLFVTILVGYFLNFVVNGFSIMSQLIGGVLAINSKHKILNICYWLLLCFNLLVGRFEPDETTAPLTADGAVEGGESLKWIVSHLMRHWKDQRMS